MSWGFVLVMAVGLAWAYFLGYRVTPRLAGALYELVKRRMRPMTGIPPSPDKWWYTGAFGRCHQVSHERLVQILKQRGANCTLAVDVALFATTGMVCGLIGVIIPLIPLNWRSLPGTGAMWLTTLCFLRLTDGGWLGLRL